LVVWGAGIRPAEPELPGRTFQDTLSQGQYKYTKLQKKRN